MLIKAINKKTKKSVLNSSYGLTLIELMVVVAILALVTLGLVALFSGGVRSYITGDAQLKSQRDARQAMDRMVRELRHGRRAFLENEGYSIRVQIPKIDNTDEYEVTYSWSGNPHDSMYQIIKNKDEQETTVLFIDNVLRLKFDMPKSSRINIELKVDAERDGIADISLNSAVNLRNF